MFASKTKKNWEKQPDDYKYLPKKEQLNWVASKGDIWLVVISPEDGAPCCSVDKCVPYCMKVWVKLPARIIIGRTGKHCCINWDAFRCSSLSLYILLFLNILGTFKQRVSCKKKMQFFPRFEKRKNLNWY